MRLTGTLALALPLLSVASAQQSPLDQAKEQAQYWLGKLQSYLPNPNTEHPAQAAAAAPGAKVGAKTVTILDLNNWESTIRDSFKPTSKKPEEWWVLMTGGNATCYGRCGQIEAAFNESAQLFAATPSSPSLALINCDYQPILCNSWSAGPPGLWIMEVGAPTEPVPIRKVGLNTTSTTSKTFTDLYASQSYKSKDLYEGYFHPFDGAVAKAGLAIPLAYVTWAFALVPSWVVMIGISFISRNMM
jgi:hypothetical protein